MADQAERGGRPRRQCKPSLLWRRCLSVPARRCRCALHTWLGKQSSL